MMKAVLETYKEHLSSQTSIMKLQMIDSDLDPDRIHNKISSQIYVSSATHHVILEIIAVAAEIIVTTMVILVLLMEMIMSVMMAMIMMLIMDLKNVYLLIHKNI